MGFIGFIWGKYGVHMRFVRICFTRFQGPSGSTGLQQDQWGTFQDSVTLVGKQCVLAPAIALFDSMGSGIRVGGVVFAWPPWILSSVH